MTTMRCSLWSTLALAGTALLMNGAALFGCEGASNVGPGPAVPTVIASDTPIPAKDAGSTDLGKMCGCSLCEPVLSNDPCASDDDCAPATPCHATRCVAKANAEPRKPDTMCTQELRCDAIEANACACVKGSGKTQGACAMVPRRK
jgi:hypothetical protein